MPQPPANRETLRARLVGRTFVHPAFDYLLIGGGLSLIVIPLAYKYSGGQALVSFELLPWFILLSNSAHFAASTVRLYTKPGAREALPFLTMALPLLTIAVLSVCFLFADQTGPVLQAIYLSWSPFHYAAQAYGLAVMYSFRSGRPLSLGHKNILWWIAILPFLRLLLQSSDKHFLWWFHPEATSVAVAPWSLPLQLAAALMGILALLLPVVLYVRLWRSKEGPLPLISLLVVVTNGIWFLVFRHYDGFVWATIFHGLQYLCIATIFHVKEQMARPENRRSPAYHTLWFYGASVLLGYALFNCWPQAYILLGFGPAESVLLVIAVINIHHFIVDAYIWKMKPGDSNRHVVTAGEAARPRSAASATPQLEVH
jgi:hypothetical protein